MIRSTQFLGQGLIQGQRLFPGYQDEFSFFTPLDALQLQALLLTSLPSLQPYFCLPFMPLALPTQLLTTPGLPSLPQLCHNSTLPFNPLFIPFLIILNAWILFQKCSVWCHVSHFPQSTVPIQSPLPSSYTFQPPTHSVITYYDLPRWNTHCRCPYSRYPTRRSGGTLPFPSKPSKQNNIYAGPPRPKSV